MSQPPLPAVLAHADWSAHPSGRAWTVANQQANARYLADLPQMPHGLHVLDEVARLGAGEPALIGFDFPIGLPAAFARSAGIDDFPDWLTKVTDYDWDRFRALAVTPADIATTRPFYPFRPGGTAQAQLVAGLSVESFASLRRHCDGRTRLRAAASCLFWTLGAQQCGRAALAGWHEVLRPALQAGDRGVALWPFAGDLPNLLAEHAVTIVETYPAEAGRQLGLLGPSAKRQQTWRRKQARLLLAQAIRLDLDLAPQLAHAIEDGFGPHPDGENEFDATIGLLAMLLVVRGYRSAGPPADRNVRRVEGWIMGLDPSELASTE